MTPVVGGVDGPTHWCARSEAPAQRWHSQSCPVAHSMKHDMKGKGRRPDRQTGKKECRQAGGQTSTLEAPEAQPADALLLAVSCVCVRAVRALALPERCVALLCVCVASSSPSLPVTGSSLLAAAAWSAPPPPPPLSTGTCGFSALGKASVISHVLVRVLCTTVEQGRSETQGCSHRAARASLEPTPRRACRALAEPAGACRCCPLAGWRGCPPPWPR